MVVVQLRQLELQALQEVVELTVNRTYPLGQVETQEPLTRANPVRQLVQAVAVQLVQLLGQGEQRLGLVVGYVAGGQIVRQEPL